jgi:hypothetical protein
LGGSSLARLMTALRPEGLREPPDRSPSSASRRGASSIFFRQVRPARVAVGPGRPFLRDGPPARLKAGPAGRPGGRSCGTARQRDLRPVLRDGPPERMRSLLRQPRVRAPTRVRGHPVAP